MSKNQTHISNRKVNIFLQNLNIDKTVDKKEYNINDFNELLKDQLDELELNIVFDMESTNFEIITNPLVNIYNYSNERKNNDGDLLFQNEFILNNEIFCIHISEFLNYAKEHTDEFNLQNTLNVYYPKLYQKNIFTINELNDKSITTNELFQKKYDAYNQLIRNHYSFYNNEISEELKKQYYFGIKSIDFVFYNKNSFMFPHEIFFKKIHSSKDIPIIRNNPGRKMENMYRIYAPDKDKYGKKIPYFNQDRMIELTNTLKKSKCISLLFVEKLGDYQKRGSRTKNISIIVDINESGYIFFHTENLDYMNIEDMNKLCKHIINKIIKKLIQYFDPSQLIYNNFENIDSKDVEIIEIKYSLNLNKERVFQFVDNINYFNQIIQLKRNEDTILFSYKRVSNYNKLTDIQGYMVELTNRQVHPDDIIDIVGNKFNISKEESTEKLNELLQLITKDDHTKEEQMNIQRINKIKTNSGFNIVIEHNKKIKDFECIIHSIDNIYYLNHVNVFLLNLLIMSLNKIEQSVIDKYFASALNGPVTKEQDIIVQKPDSPKKPVKVKDEYSIFIRPPEEFSDFEESDDENENKSQSDNEEIIVNDIEAIYNMQKRTRNRNAEQQLEQQQSQNQSGQNEDKAEEEEQGEEEEEDEQPEQKSQNQLVQNENKGEELSENGPISTTINSSVSAASSNGEQENENGSKKEENGPVSTTINTSVSAASSNGEQENGKSVFSFNQNSTCNSF